MNQEKQTENAPAAAPNRPASGPQTPGSPDHLIRSVAPHSKLPFFRMILWILVYAASALFLMSLILLRFRIQTMVIGGALVACIVLLVCTYALQ